MSTDSASPPDRSAHRHPLLRRTQAVWDWLTASPASVTHQSDRRQAQLLSSLLLLTMALGLLAVVAPLVLEPAQYSLQDPNTLLGLGALAVLAVLYGLSRAGYSQPVAIMTVAFASLVVFIIAWPDHSRDDVGMLTYLLIPILLSSALLSLRMTALLVAIDGTGALLFALVVGNGPDYGALQIALFVLLISSLILVAMRHRQRIAEDRRALLAENEARYRSLVEVSPDAIIICRGNELVFSNAAWERLRGMQPPAQVASTCLLDYIKPSRHAAVKTRLLQAQHSGQPLAFFEETLLRADGTTIEVEIGGAPFMLQGEPAMQLVIRDITERQRALERSLELVVQRERAEVLTSFIDEVSQSLKTPLSSMKLSLAILARAGDTTKQQQHLGSLQTQTAYLAGVLDDMRSIVNIDTSGGTTHRLYDLNEIARRVALAHETAAEQQGVAFRFLPSAERLNVLVNRDEMTRAINALVAHAVARTPHEAGVTLRIGREAHHAVITIQHDDGPPITPEQQTRLLARFYSAGASSDDSLGLALGLAIARRIIEAHGGTITIESGTGADGRGNTFFISLPAHDALAAAAQEQ